VTVLASSKTANRKEAAIVTTVRNAARTLDSFVSYHLAIGFAHFYLFFDDPDDPDLRRFAAHPAVSAIARDSHLRRAWTSLPQYQDQADFVDSEVMARQVLNVELAMTLARERGIGWLLHIDSDELFYSPGQSADEHFAWLESQSLDAINYPNYEALPERDEIVDFFREVDLFKVPPQLCAGPLTEAGLRIMQATPQLQPNVFHFYSCGKSAVKLGTPDMQPKGVHSFVRPNNKYAAAQSTQHFILHYACCGFETFWTKYVTLGRFSDQWWRRYDIAAMIGTVHLEARDVVARGDREAARAFYRRRIALQDKHQADTLIASHILTRFSQPREILLGVERYGMAR
jgi:hypothetical protein